MTRKSLFIFGLVSLSSCVTDPFHNQVIDHTTDAISVVGWALSGGKEVTMQCRPYLVGGDWINVKTFTSNNSSIDGGGDDVYYFGGSAIIPENCWYGWHSQFTTQLRFKDAKYTYFVYDEEGKDCVYSNALHDGAINAGHDCRLTTDSEDTVNSIYVHARDE